jgi:hypothetical protein
MLDRVPVLAPALERARAELGPSPFLVYLLHDRRGVLLFVGVTDQGPRQVAERHGGAAWYGDVARVEFERAASGAEAAARARRLIERRRPAFRSSGELEVEGVEDPPGRGGREPLRTR